MRHIPVFLSLCLLTSLSFNKAAAQNSYSDWRVAKKTFIAANGQRYTTEFDYDNDGRIKTVRTLSVTGALSTTAGNFQFGRNNKPSSYTITYNREGGEVSVALKYDNSGRIVELIKTVNPRDVSTFKYRYTGTSIIITEQKTSGQSNITDGRINNYTEQGHYSETVSDAASQVITTTITLNGKQNSAMEPWPDNLMGGYETPLFFGTQAYGSAPQVTSTKNNDGLITNLLLTTTSSTRKFEYSYIKVGATREEDPQQTGTKIIISTNINCNEGKLQVERILDGLDGVFAAPVDIRTGKIALNYSPDGTAYADIIKAINDAGFDADRKKSASPDKNPCVQKINPQEDTPKQTGRNIFDARKGFKKTPIKFVPFVVTPDAAKKGFKMDSVYTWTAPGGEVKTASGAEILTQVNEMEKELCLRGHTLRNKDGFKALSYKLMNPKAVSKIPKVATKTNTVKTNMGDYNKLPVIKTRHNKLPDISGAFATTIPGDVGVYFGRITANSGEFQGIISTTGSVDNSKCNKQCPLDLVVSLDAKTTKSLNISNCILEISANPNRKPNDIEDPLATANFNFKSYAKAKYGTENMTVSGDAPPSFHTLYYFPVKLNDLSKLGKAEIKPTAYYAYIKFYNDKGQLLYYSSYNTAIVQNKIDAPIFIGQNKNIKASFSDGVTDPAGLFGMYYKSNTITSAYSTTRDESTLVITESATVSGDLEIGAQYYNFWHLLDDDQPKYEQKPMIRTNFSSTYNNYYRDGVPPIRVPGTQKSNDMNNYSGYNIDYSLFDGTNFVNYNKSSPYTQTVSVPYNIFNERFFIGPVPCRITVDMSGNASFSRKAVMDTLDNGKVSLSTSVTPHLDLTLTGKGGVDAAIAYATIVAKAKVIEVDLPVNVKASKDADIDASLIVTALSGQIYFTAGICIPIPWFDDICTSFRIDIFNWTGDSSTYPLVK